MMEAAAIGQVTVSKPPSVNSSTRALTAPAARAMTKQCCQFRPPRNIMMMKTENNDTINMASVPSRLFLPSIILLCR